MKSVAAALLAVAACHSAPSAPVGLIAPAAPAAPTNAGPVTISIIGTNDVHGAISRLPLFAGYVANVRAARKADGGGVVLIDAGDIFQGTFESNLGEGVDMIRAYNALGYTAATIGNHEFDYGPVGPAMRPGPGEDPQGALKARISEATFPFVDANLVDVATQQTPHWANLNAGTIVTVAGHRIGIVGATTESTPHSTMPSNFAGLAIGKPEAIAAAAKDLRAHGAELVILTAHLGSECLKFDDPHDSSSCDRKQEIFEVLPALHGVVDAIVAGHTHAGVAHELDGIPVIESFSSALAFGRIDLHVAADGHVIDSKIFPPQRMCPLAPGASDEKTPPIDCKPDDYEGAPVVRDPKIQAVVDDALARAGTARTEKLGITLTAPITKLYRAESIEGDWFTDLMRAAQPTAQLALTNGGGLRADIPAGEVTYGQVFEAMPFDNRFTLVDVTGVQVRQLVSENLANHAGLMSWSGLTVKARCAGSKLDVAIMVGGKPLVDTKRYTIATTDFLATGGDGSLAALHLPADAFHPTEVIVREAIVELLRHRKGADATIDPKRIFDGVHGRLDFPGARPVTCGGSPP